MQATDFLPAVVALAASVVLTPIVRSVAIRAGMIAQPQVDRWHRRPTALLGGVAIALSVVFTWWLFSGSVAHNSQAWAVVLGSLFLGLVGFVDDVLHIKPYQKLICQVFAAALVLSAGLMLPWTTSQSANAAITFFWLIGVTNAINLLDNMDGLAAGVSATAAIFLAISLFQNGQPQEAMMLAMLGAVLIGFLLYNSNPASIFMGDTGSMFVGFFLAGAALMSATGARSRSFVAVLAVPVLVLFIPIFDTTLVTILRKAAGRPASQGGRDHTSHRLVALGMSERRAVWLLYGLAALSGLLAVTARHMHWLTGMAVMVGFVIVLSLLGIYLGGVRVYDEATAAAARQRPIVAFMFEISYKRRLFEVVLDLLLILIAFHAAARLVAPSVLNPDWTHLDIIAALVFTQMLSLLVSGSYRGMWRYVSIDDLLTYARGIILGAILSYVVVRFAVKSSALGLSFFVLNAVVLFVMVSSSRLAFRVFRRLLPSRTPLNSRRALIFGAGDGGEILLRELQNNQALGLVPIGFVDDDPLKAGKTVHGLKVHHSTPSTLLQVCTARGAEEVVISTSKLPAERLDAIARDFAAAGIVLRRMRIELDVVNPERVVAEEEARRDNVPRSVASISDARKRKDSSGARVAHQ